MVCPVSRTLLVLSCSVCLLGTAGCSLFRSDVADVYSPQQALHLPDTRESAAAEPPPVDPLAVASLQTVPPATAPSAATTSLASTGQMPLPLEDRFAVSDTAEASSEAKPASCFVEIRALNEKPKRIRMLLDDAAYVQKVLEQTGLIKEFRNMNIELSRKLPGGERHKLEVRYDRKNRRVTSAFDYALHPNDLLVVREESKTSIDEMLKKLAGPLAR